MSKIEGIGEQPGQELRDEPNFGSLKRSHGSKEHCTNSMAGGEEKEEMLRFQAGVQSWKVSGAGC